MLKKILFWALSFVSLSVFIILVYYSNLILEKEVIINKSYIQNELRKNIPNEVNKKLNINRNYIGKYKNIDINLKVHDVILSLENNQIKTTTLVTLKTINGTENIMFENFNEINYYLYDDTIKMIGNLNYKGRELIEVKKINLTSNDYSDFYKKKLKEKKPDYVSSTLISIAFNGASTSGNKDHFTTKEEAENNYLKLIDNEIRHLARANINIGRDYFYVPTKYLRKIFNTRPETVKVSVITPEKVKIEINKDVKKESKKQINVILIVLFIIFVFSLYNLFKRKN